MSRIIVYYSKSGTTRCGAEYLGKRLQVPVVELKEQAGSSAVSAIQKKTSVLAGNPWADVSAYDEIILMSPVWAFSGVPAVNAFLKKADLKGKELRVVTFQALPRIAGTKHTHQQYREQIEKQGGKTIEHYALRGAGMNQFAGEARIHKQVDRIMKYLIVESEENDA